MAGSDRAPARGERLRLLVAAFGDPGHAFPAIALARELRRRGHEVLVETWEQWREPVEGEGLAFTAAQEYTVYPPPGPDTPDGRTAVLELKDGEIRESARDAVMRELRAHFRPEFLNRVDDIVLFKPLTLGEIERIVDLQTEDLRKRLAERNIRLELSDPARTLVARQGFDPVYGARPLKRFLQHHLETRIGRAILSGEVRDGATVEVGVKDGDLAVAIRQPEAAAQPVGTAG